MSWQGHQRLFGLHVDMGSGTAPPAPEGGRSRLNHNRCQPSALAIALHYATLMPYPHRKDPSMVITGIFVIIFFTIIARRVEYKRRALLRINTPESEHCL
ncbi:hypothetical protein MJ588_10365 [Klebsiella pneumoniae]|nr:hypothetical protein MJ588_10365 [Klebsiella pneumoniae]